MDIYLVELGQLIFEEIPKFLCRFLIFKILYVLPVS